jgi:predicted nucleic-acid-binding protein
VIGLDTNVLVRYLVEDDEAQTRAAKEVMNGLSASNPGWVSLVVLAELVWSLKKTYKLSKDGIVNVVEGLLASKDLLIEASEKVQYALLLHRNSRAGFADCLLWVNARDAGCQKVVTFDRVAARDLGMELIA